MNIMNAKTQVFIDGQEVHALGITSNDEYMVIDSDATRFLGAHIITVIYPDGSIFERSCDTRIEFDEEGKLECRYYPIQNDG